MDVYLDSRKLNLDCKKAIEEAIRGRILTVALKADAGKKSRGTLRGRTYEFCWRGKYTIRELSHEGRFSRQNKDWAETYRSPGKYQPGQKSEPDYDRKPPGSFRWFYRHGKS